MAKGVTPRSQDYAAWYTDVVTKAELADYGPVKGTMVIKPYGFALWEHIKSALDDMLQATGHENAYFPLLIPKSFLAREAEHVEGFAKECAVVTHTRLMADGQGGLIVDPASKLEEEAIIRPTSETVIWFMYKKWIQSYRDLPLLINQWANVVRWEMRTRLFLRTTEFLWQEGHTAHATAEEAEEETLRILEIYQRLAQEHLALPVITGLKTETEKFAGAVRTYAIEAMMGDRRALQAGTSHNLGQNFAKAFGVTYQARDNREEFVYATSWGVSTRLVGAVIMAHGDDKGLRLPPRIAPVQVVTVPIFRDDQGREQVREYLAPLLKELAEKGIRVHTDWREESPGFKFNDWEQKGVPLRLEIGPRDVTGQQGMLVRRDTGEKQTYPKDALQAQIPALLEAVQQSYFDQALQFRKEHTYSVDSYDEFREIMGATRGFVCCGWDGDPETEAAIKADTRATIRTVPREQNTNGLRCIYTGKPARYEVIFAKAY